jgi:hypothetical protein
MPENADVQMIPVAVSGPRGQIRVDCSIVEGPLARGHAYVVATIWTSGAHAYWFRTANREREGLEVKLLDRRRFSGCVDEITNSFVQIVGIWI